MRGLIPALFVGLVLGLAIAAAPRIASASDGVLEINQACAANGGCFAGDVAGFPVTISASGSYRLSSELAVPDAATDGIVVSSDDVAIDLNGFTIRGPIVCLGTPIVCTGPFGGGAGIRASSIFLSGISVRNGAVRGMGGDGVFLGEQASASDLRVRSNRTRGISVQAGSTVSGCLVQRNGGNGLESGNGTTLSGNTAIQNGGSGIASANRSTLTGNTATENALWGILAGSGVTVLGNTASDNGEDGIFVTVGATVSNNAAYSNGDDGIQSSGGGLLKGNTVSFNGGFGLEVGAQSGYRENVMNGNTAGTVAGPSSVDLGSNLCNGSALCP